jgi:lactate dehydrogenase-like 2-hydroxyacid dehydrogenase
VTAPAVLVVPRELDFITAELENCYRVHRYWDELLDTDLAEVRALVCLGHQSPAELIERLPALRLVACYTTGYDAIDVADLNRRGIQVSHAPGVTAEPVGEFALALILASYRNVVRGDWQVRTGNWVSNGTPLIGRSIEGARVGIVGLGAIGTALARRCHALNMQVSWWGRREKIGVPWPRAGSLAQLAQDCDVLAVCASADASNIGLISADIIDAVGPRGLLVNVARGQLVDEAALIDALKAGKLGAAALDVFESEPTPPGRWDGVPNVICTPHIAGASRDNLANMSAMLRANLDAFFSGQPLVNPVPKPPASAG